jgi:hypothetical protein
MRKLELKDIVGYLPYDLQYWIPEIKSNGVLSFDNIRGILADVLYPDAEVHVYKPYFLLRPMSDLIKPIIVKGYNDDKAFVPLEVLSYTLFGAVGLIIDQKMCFGYRNKDTFYWDENDFTVNYHDSDDYINVSFLEVYDLLDQWHFDYRNLIAEGLAIDINTLNQ